MKKSYIEIRNERECRTLISEILRETKIAMDKELELSETGELTEVIDFKDNIIFNDDYTISINGVEYIDVYRDETELEDEVFDADSFIKVVLRSYLIAAKDSKTLQYVPPLHDDIYGYVGEYCDTKLFEFARAETELYIQNNPDEFCNLSEEEFDRAYDGVYINIHEGEAEAYFGYSSYDLEYRISKVLDMYELAYVYEAPVGNEGLDYYLKMTNVSMKSFLNIDYKNPSPLELNIERK